MFILGRFLRLSKKESAPSDRDIANNVAAAAYIRYSDLTVSSVYKVYKELRYQIGRTSFFYSRIQPRAYIIMLYTLSATDPFMAIRNNGFIGFADCPVILLCRHICIYLF